MTTQTPKLPDGYKPGLEGVIAGLSQISEVNSDIDALVFRGYQAHELAEKATFSEVAYLLLYGKLPNVKELEDFRQDLIKERSLSPEVLNLMKLYPKNAPPMTTFRAAVSALHMTSPYPAGYDTETNLKIAKSLIAKGPTIVAALHRLRIGKEPIEPNPNLKHGANFIYMITGKEPDEKTAKAFDSTMILYTEHGFNASTFAALVTASTLSDMYSAIASAIGTLKGPLHGGANEAAIDMLLKIGSADKVEPWLKERLAKKEKIMGFGHRVYKKQDSRAPFMKKLAEQTAKLVGDNKLFHMSCVLEDAMMREKKLFPNVDYHCAVFYYLIGLPIEVYTPIFAMSRMAGWTAHVIEQHSANRLIRPKCVYQGARDLSFVPVEKR